MLFHPQRATAPNVHLFSLARHIKINPFYILVVVHILLFLFLNWYSKKGGDGSTQ